VRQARERAGLAADELAGQIKLAKSTLDALERDDFAALSEPVYVRGYYRKIAKVLPVSESELLAAYNACAASGRGVAARARPAAQRIPLAGGVDAGSTRRPHGQGVGLAVAVVVVAGLLFLLADKNSSSRATRSTPSATAPASTSPPAADASGIQPESPLSTAMPSATSEPAPAAEPNQLVLEFSESSFVRVEDSRNKTLAIGLVRGGERQALDGAPPYSVFLGNAKNVKVFFNGQPMDFSAHINSQNDTARFTVP
jgi:cytoskeleton protein RodZ